MNLPDPTFKWKLSYHLSGVSDAEWLYKDEQKGAEMHVHAFKLNGKTEQKVLYVIVETGETYEHFEHLVVAYKETKAYKEALNKLL